MENSPKHLLEQYIIGKDDDNYKLLEAIYEENAEVEFEIHSNAITFPNKIVGNREIAKILSADFNKKYEKIRTYYLSANISGGGIIEELPWLVVMKERGKGITRIGTGYYNWRFSDYENDLKIVKHKIYIHTMLEIPDVQAKQLREIQEQLEYPWVERQVAIDLLKNYENISEIAEYLY